jgi:FlaA1/EpsC-like NDP-sugar epimerase
MSEVLEGKASMRLEEVSVEDLLGRPPVAAQNLADDYVRGKRVLITGAGGSIGSELCRQVLGMDPAQLILFGHGENSLHKIHQELCARHAHYAERILIVVGSVADEIRVWQAFSEYRPQIVFHAAAHKHVPIMEANVAEAVQNNVLGTHNVAGACGRARVERMVLISTDKAVYPSSIMGATKWLCEETLNALAEKFPATRYVTVRFGNVLGSRGSVVPIFREQIRRGGPVTVTHPEMTRYFMSIPEAVHLVLQAGALGKSRDLFLLEMGTPVKIVDLARDMIRLCGFTPDEEIPIVFTGLRPGEKMHESLTTDESVMEPSSCAGLAYVRRRPHFSPEEFSPILPRLRALAEESDAASLLAYMSELVPTIEVDWSKQPVSAGR